MLVVQNGDEIELIRYNIPKRKHVLNEAVIQYRVHVDDDKD